MKRKSPPTFTSANKIWIGIDNGVSGTIGWSGYDNGDHIFGQVKTPVFKEQNYTKAKANISRVHIGKLSDILKELKDKNHLCVLMERPMVNPGRWTASISAVRALEATLNVLEFLDLPHQYVDSKEWQKVMLPSGLKGMDELKKASVSIGKRLFPTVNCSPDADGILIAEWARRGNK